VENREKAEAQSFWNDFFNVFAVRVEFLFARHARLVITKPKQKAPNL
jgi:hypothetical protein